MTTALVGLLGVIAGVVLSGGVSAWLAHRADKRNGRVAAMVIGATLAEVSFMISATLSSKSLGDHDEWGRLMEPWREHRSDLAKVAEWSQFRKVASAFMSFSAFIALHHSLAEQGGLVPGSPGQAQMEDTLQRCQAGIDAARETLEQVEAALA